MALIHYLLLSAIALSVTARHKLPDYIKPCSKSDPNFQECTKQHAIEAFPQILKGDKKLKLPPLVPYKLPLVNIDQPNFKLKLTDVVVDGLQTVTFEKANVDIANKKVSFSGKVGLINALATYEINGRILVLPITGNGPANITFVDSTYKYDLDFSTFEKEGKEYVKYDKSNLDFEPSRSYYKLDNLFNGDKRLGDEMQRFLDENWKEIGQDLNPALAQTIDAIITKILITIVTDVPMDEIFAN